MRVLHLTLKKKWFDLIASGEKKEEYRDFKDYWLARLFDKDLFKNINDFSDWLINKPNDVTIDHVSNNFDCIQFRNGYSKDAPIITVEFKGIEVGYRFGFQSWGATPNTLYFIIKIGDIIK